MRAHKLGLVLVLGAVLAAPAQGQRVHGTVTDSATKEAVSGAVLSLTDSAGKFLARSVADREGAYSLPLIRPGATLSVMRIGFRPQHMTLPRLSGDIALDVRMMPIPSMLSAVSSSANRVCAGNKPTIAALDLWEQARAAMLASIVSRESNPADVRLFFYSVRRNPVTKRMAWDSTDIKDVVAMRSYVAGRPPWAFAAEGYMREATGGGRTYYAPDEETLLDPTFAETHCLHVVGEDDKHRGQAGIGFEPMPAEDRDTIVDVSGVLWLDAKAPRLRSLEFTYTNLEPDARGAGGELYYITTPGGVPMVNTWVIHTPVVVVDPPPGSDVVYRRPPPRPQRTNGRIIAYSETGGQVVSARWHDGSEWHGSHPRIVGTIKDTSGKPMAGQRVWVAGGRDTVTSKADGTFEFPYTMRSIVLLYASDSGLTRHGLSRTPPVTVRLDEPFDYDVDLTEYPRADVLSLACPAKSYKPGTGVLIGMVVDSSGEPAAGAAIEVLAKPTSDTVRTRPRQGEAGHDGKFVVCGAALDMPLRVRAAKGDAFGEARIDAWTEDVIELRIVLDRRMAPNY